MLVRIQPDRPSSWKNEDSGLQIWLALIVPGQFFNLQFYSPVVQSAERLTLTQKVDGANPSGAANFMDEGGRRIADSAFG